ncbi:MAG: Spo0B domain-containing protein [Bacillota bacterium]
MGSDGFRELELLRAQRHSFLNHLQVISGWLQLERSDRAAQYIRRVAAQLEAEGQVLRRVDSVEAGLFILEVSLLAEPYGVALEWRLTGGGNPGGLDEARPRIVQALEEAARLPEPQRRLMIHLGESVTVHRPLATGEG